MERKKIDIGYIIASYIQKKGYAKAAVARKLGRNKDVIGFLLKQKSLKCQDVYDFSLAFQYNFFKEIANLVPNFELPLLKEEEEQKIVIDALKKENEELKKQVEQLEKTLKLLNGR